MDNSKKIYNAAIYVRLSKEDGDVGDAKKAESNSISNQKALIENFLQNKKNIKVVSVRVDDGYSGSNFDRPAFQLMMEDIKEGRVNCVVVKDLSRFGREYIDSGRYIERLFPALGVRFIAVNDHYDSMEGKSQSDDILIPFKNLINDAYSRDISIKIRSHLEVKRKNGEFVGAFSAYGYKKSDTDRNKLVVDDFAAGVVQDIFKWKIQGMSMDAIAQKLNDMGVLSPMEYKNSNGENFTTSFKINEQAVWGAVAVRRILENEIYIGTLIQGKQTTPNHKIKAAVVKEKSQWSVVENIHESIVSKRDFEIVQRLLQLDTRTSPGKEGVYLLSGIAVCAECGALMARKVSTVGGKKYVYYTCSMHKKYKKCSPHRIKEYELEDTILTVLQLHISHLLEINKALKDIEELPNRKSDMKKLQQRLEKKEEEIKRYSDLKISLYEDYKDALISKEEYIMLKEQFEIKKALAQDASIRIQREAEGLRQTEHDGQKWIQYFLKYQNIETLTRNVVVELIRNVQIHESGGLTIIFDFADEYKHLRQVLSEVQKVEKFEERRAV